MLNIRFNSHHLKLAYSSSLPLLCVLCFYVVNISAQNWRAVANGIEYAEVRREVSGKDVNINLLRLDLKKVRLDVHHAKDSVIGTEPTSVIAARYKAVAAINAGFFRLDTSPFLGDPQEMLVIDGKLLSEAVNDRSQILINNTPTKTDVVFARTAIQQSIKIGSETFKINGINRERKKDEIVIYTPEFGPGTPTATDDGVELVIVKGNISATGDKVASSIIPRNGYVISASGAMRQTLIDAAKQERYVTLVNNWSGLPAELEKDRSRLDIVAGVPQIVKNGKVDITWEQERTSKAFVETRHPRTAVAKLKDGNFLMITVDGRTQSSGGIGLQDLAEYLITLGAVEAINLDGGGSTTMFVDGKVVNHPSDKEGERKVGDAILVTLRKRK